MFYVINYRVGVKKLESACFIPIKGIAYITTKTIKKDTKQFSINCSIVKNYTIQRFSITRTGIKAYNMKLV